MKNVCILMDFVQYAHLSFSFSDEADCWVEELIICFCGHGWFQLPKEYFWMESLFDCDFYKRKKE